MSMTTEPSRGLGSTFAGAIAGWIAILALVTLLAEPTRDAIVFGAPGQTLALLEGSDTRILSSQSAYVVVRGREQGFVKALYGNGAWLVLPARGRSCLDPNRGRA